MKAQTSEAPCRVWIDRKEKLASFHPIPGGELMEFQDAGRYHEYLLQLSDSWYAFQ